MIVADILLGHREDFIKCHRKVIGHHVHVEIDLESSDDNFFVPAECDE